MINVESEHDLTISVIIPMHNAGVTVERCLEAVMSSSYPVYETIVVDDCSNDSSRTIVERFPVKLIALTGEPFGPAYARNQGAKAAQGEVIFFVDSDVIVRQDTLDKVAETFLRNSEYAATFGSYDDSPSEGEFLSQYKNLSHHFVHQRAKEEAGTFWAGCGAIRRSVFTEIGGFDARQYPRPSIEDIELGYRLRAAGFRIYLNKDIQVTHLKRWTLLGWFKTDFLDRAIPWTLLILRQRNLPNDLNLEISQRLSALLLVLMMLCLVFSISLNFLALFTLLTLLFLLVISSSNLSEGSRFYRISWKEEALIYLMFTSLVGLALFSDTVKLLLPLTWLLGAVLLGRFLPVTGARVKSGIFTAILLGFIVGFGILLLMESYYWAGVIVFLTILMIVLLNRRIYSFLIQKRGVSFAIASIPFHMIYYLYSLTAFVLGNGIFIYETKLKSR